MSDSPLFVICFARVICPEIICHLRRLQPMSYNRICLRHTSIAAVMHHRNAAAHFTVPREGGVTIYTEHCQGRTPSPGQQRWRHVCTPCTRARLICLLALDCLLILFTVVLVSARHFSRPPCPLGMVLWQSVLCALFILTALLGLLYWIGGHYTY